MNSTAVSDAALGDADDAALPRPRASITEGRLLSDQWYRVAASRPRLDPQVQIERIAYRGTPSIVLVLPDSQRRLRLNEAAWAFVGRCDGRLDAQTLWEQVLRLLRDEAPTQDDTLDVLLQLHRSGALQFDRAPDFGLLSGPGGGLPHADPLHRQSLLAIRLPLGNPDSMLTRLRPLALAVFSPAGFALWCTAVVALLLMLPSMLPTLREFVGRWLHSPHVLVITALAFPMLKAVHELWHGLAVKRWGGVVPQWGITLMAFMPVPWVDASAADGFAHPRHRFVVSAAGLMVELAIGAAALGLAAVLEPGVLRDACLAVFVVAAVASLAVNANPLLRFDGYHALSDALELPNLAERSQRWWLHLLQRLLALRPPPLPPPLRREQVWWWTYAPLALACRCLLALGLTVWIGSVSSLLGLALTAYFVVTMGVGPVLRGLRFLWGGDVAERSARRARRRALCVFLVLMALLGAVPWPDTTVARGVVWLPDEAAVRAGQAGLVVEVLASDGDRVRQGDLLFRLEDLGLPAERVRLTSAIVGLQTERIAALADDLGKAQRLQAELDNREKALARLDERLALLEVRAPHDGVLSIARAADWPGRHVARGTLLAQVLPLQDADSAAAAGDRPGPRLRVAIDAGHAADRLASARTASVAGSGSDDRWTASVSEGALAAAVQQLPSAALGDRQGGDVITDPSDPQGLRSARPMVVLELQVDARVDRAASAASAGSAVSAVSARPSTPLNPELPLGLHWGERVWVRFDHGFAPLAVQWARGLQQALLLHFAPRA
jgi:putative peptide zinc metalloprotease protein